MGLNRDKSLFYYSIANMLDAGASLVPALRQEFPRRFNGVAGALFTAIDAGHNLSSAMAEHSVFSHFECMLISVGEHSGMLPQVLKTLAEWFENKNRIEKSILIGLVYPLLVYYVAGPLLCIIEVFSNQMSGIGFSVIKLVLWWAAPIVIFFLWKICAPVLRRNAFMGAILDNLPFFGKLQFSSETAYFMRALGMCLNAGMGIYNALRLACNVCINERFRDHYLVIAQIVNDQGCHFSEAFSKQMTAREKSSNILPFITMGEETGTLPEQCLRLADLFQEEYSHRITVFSKLLPVAVYLAIALFLAFKIISIFSSYIGMLNSL